MSGEEYRFASDTTLADYVRARKMEASRLRAAAFELTTQAQTIEQEADLLTVAMERVRDYG